MIRGGNSWLDRGFDAIFGEGAFNSVFGDRGSAWSDRTFGNVFEKFVGEMYAVQDAKALENPEAYPPGSYEDFTKESLSGASGAIASGDGFVVDVATGLSGVGVGYKLGKGALSALRTKTAEKVSVYFARDRLGNITYVGITNNIARRAAEHARVGRGIEEVIGNLSRDTARALEQAIIDKIGLSNLTNKINSIAKTNPLYQSVTDVASKYLSKIGL